jgi:hypothetical protein
MLKDGAHCMAHTSNGSIKKCEVHEAIHASHPHPNKHRISGRLPNGRGHPGHLRDVPAPSAFSKLASDSGHSLGPINRAAKPIWSSWYKIIYESPLLVAPSCVQ